MILSGHRVAWGVGTDNKPADRTGVVAVLRDGTVADAGWTIRLLGRPFAVAGLASGDVSAECRQHGPNGGEEVGGARKALFEAVVGGLIRRRFRPIRGRLRVRPRLSRVVRPTGWL